MYSNTNYQYTKGMFTLPVYKQSPLTSRKVVNFTQNGLNLSPTQFNNYVLKSNYYNINNNINNFQNIYNNYLETQMPLRKTNSIDFNYINNNANININSSLNNNIISNINNNKHNNLTMSLNNNIGNDYINLQNNDILYKRINSVDNIFNSINNITTQNQEQAISGEKLSKNLYPYLISNLNSNQNINNDKLNLIKIAPINTQRSNSSCKNVSSDDYIFDHHSKSSRCKCKSKENINSDHHNTNNINKKYENTILNNNQKHSIIKDGKKLANIDINNDVQEKDDTTTNYSASLNSYNTEQKLINDNSNYNFKNNNNNNNKNKIISIGYYKKDENENFNNINNEDAYKISPINNKNQQKLILPYNNNDKNKLEDVEEEYNYIKDINVYENETNKIYNIPNHTNSFYKTIENLNKEDNSKNNLNKKNLETIELFKFPNSNSNFNNNKNNYWESKNPILINQQINIHTPNPTSNFGTKNIFKTSKTIKIGEPTLKSKHSFAKKVDNNIDLSKKCEIKKKIEKLENSPNKKIILKNNDENNKDFDIIKIDNNLNAEKRIQLPTPIFIKTQRFNNNNILFKEIHDRSPPRFNSNTEKISNEKTLVKVKSVKNLNKLNENNNKFNEVNNKIEQINHIDNKNYKKANIIINNKLNEKNNYFKQYKLISKAGKYYDGKEKINQDKGIVQISINNIYGLNLFGVLDGHGEKGHHISNLSSTIIIDQFTKFITKLNTINLETIYQEIKKNNY